MFNTQITSYKQSMDDNNQLESQENSEKLFQIGDNIIENNLKKVMNPNDTSIKKNPIL